MADATSFQVSVRTEDSKKLLLKNIFEYGKVSYNWQGGKLYFYALNEGTISIANTGAATDTQLRVFDTALFSFQQSACFNTTLQNDDKEKLALLGFLVMYDHTTTSPDTDVGTIEFNVEYMFSEGVAISNNAKIFTQANKHELQSNVIVESAAIETAKYAGPLAIKLAIPAIIEKSKPVTEYLASYTALNRASYAAHTAVTTYTIKVMGWAVLCETSVLAQYKNIDEFWNQLLKGD